MWTALWLGDVDGRFFSIFFSVANIHWWNMIVIKLCLYWNYEYETTWYTHVKILVYALNEAFSSAFSVYCFGYFVLNFIWWFALTDKSQMQDYIFKNLQNKTIGSLKYKISTFYIFNFIVHQFEISKVLSAVTIKEVLQNGVNLLNETRDSF